MSDFKTNFEPVAIGKRDFVLYRLKPLVYEATGGIVEPLAYIWAEDGAFEYVELRVRGEARPVRVNVHMDSKYAIVKDVMKAVERYM